MPSLSLPYDSEWIEIIQHHITAGVERSGVGGVVLGVSGGLDSAVVLYLVEKALGKENVTALIMPSSNTPLEDTSAAEKICKNLGVRAELVDIDPLVLSFLKTWNGEPPPVAVGNLHARIRMVLLYLHANTRGLLVTGTSNKSEILVGYFTKYGDGGADILPIGDLYKTQVRQIAVDLGVPEEIIKKRPTAGLLPGQYDEDDLGIGYELLDVILYGIELGLQNRDIMEALTTTHPDGGVDEKEVERIRKMVYKNAHKRGLGYIPKIGFRTVGIDWREDLTW